MTLNNRSRLTVFLVLAATLVFTRLNHFGAVPDASWAVFLASGFYLRGSLRWAFPALMALAVVVDYVVITGTGANFWTHYCVSPGYWMLVPAHLSLWAGGSLLRRHYAGLEMKTLGLLLLVVFVSVAVCHFFAQGGFYWLSDAVAEPSIAGWAKNYADWFLPYLRTTGTYIALATVVHTAMTLVLRPAATVADRAAG